MRASVHEGLSSLLRPLTIGSLERGLVAGWAARERAAITWETPRNKCFNLVLRGDGA